MSSNINMALAVSLIAAQVGMPIPSLHEAALVVERLRRTVTWSAFGIELTASDERIRKIASHGKTNDDLYYFSLVAYSPRFCA